MSNNRGKEGDAMCGGVGWSESRRLEFISLLTGCRLALESVARTWVGNGGEDEVLRGGRMLNVLYSGATHKNQCQSAKNVSSLSS